MGPDRDFGGGAGFCTKGRGGGEIKGGEKISIWRHSRKKGHTGTKKPKGKKRGGLKVKARKRRREKKKGATIPSKKGKRKDRKKPLGALVIAETQNRHLVSQK